MTLDRRNVDRHRHIVFFYYFFKDGLKNKKEAFALRPVSCLTSGEIKLSEKNAAVNHESRRYCGNNHPSLNPSPSVNSYGEYSPLYFD